ncbi:Undecaprenyl-phosphate 4-deoxy-4-formamido-L-arabinose transferase [Rubripirellula lacrimiformis]|uniref:Undecaprenyl-phosphate 4-deoxy-4-formamido-L-arabinose transferase n=1 Tax=Rubripirellula lacrimiformis TaxID=1930273 RepID=A0A517N3F0_9BACT|nr:glycosyltransferase family 2 protein [Rubripirellula lacrimiformis]QDT01660.1 Undecaprenyl-phosphate 4-deoxy-4-formamido-L-arabinose transferase [Rubripirellula lacrimiformis]
MSESASPSSTDLPTKFAPQLSLVLPAYNEQNNIGPCIDDLIECLVVQHGLRTEIIIVNDNSSDGTEGEVIDRINRWPDSVRLIRRHPPGGFGRAIRTGLEYATGDVVVIYMADRSDHPEDAYRYYQKIQEGYDCVFGSRFIQGAKVHRYPPLKLWVNRIVNKSIQWMFWTDMNDLTNAFKAYRRDVVKTCGPYKACHFNITLEMSLSALIGGYTIAEIPIGWEGRTWGSTNLRMREMGRRYLCTLLMLFFQRILMSDDVQSERFGRTTLATEIQGDQSSSDG